MSKSRDIADSAATINYIDGLTSDAQGQLDDKATLDGSPTFTGTVTATAFSGDGSGLTGVDSLPSQTGNAGEFLTTDGTNASWTPLSTSPTLEATAFGALSNGDKVVINVDGTVSAVYENSETKAVGSTSVFEAGTTIWLSATFDSNSNKVVIAYQDDSNGSVGTAVVGTVSGTSISFGTPVVFQTGFTDRIAATFDSNSNKVVIAYRNNSSGKAVVGTVSGTSISFGSPATFLSGGSAFEIAATFDSNENKVVVFFEDSTNADNATAIVGNVSGTSISFGSKVAFDTNPEFMSATFDSNSNKVVAFYRDQSATTSVAAVGTVSGTSISFGTPVTIIYSNTTYQSCAFDSTTNQIIFAYNLNYGQVNVGTVSGTTITNVGTATVFVSDPATQISVSYNAHAKSAVIAYAWGGYGDRGRVVDCSISGNTLSAGTAINFDSTDPDYYIKTVYDSAQNKTVISWRNTGNLNYGTSVVYRSGFIENNLTEENYIGISDSDYADSTAAKIQIIGSVDDAQSGLTAGQKYYVQNDNTLSTSPDSPSVFAGTAVSATKIIVKG